MLMAWDGEVTFIMINMETIIEKNPRSVRFSDAPWYTPGLEIIIGGQGGIGSWISMYLARQEAELYTYDMDSVDETNMGGQMYPSHAIGMNKAQAMRDELIRFCGSSTHVVANGRYEEDSMITPIMISAFDNMAARKLMFDNWCSLGKDRDIFIDGRLLAEGAQIYFVTPDREKAYRETLFEDGEVKDQPCSMKATSHCGGIIAGLMTAGLNNFITNKKEGENIRDVPFKLSYELPLLMFDIE